MEQTIGDKAEVELPRYKSHKEVWALKIKDISLGHMHDDGTEYAVLTSEDSGYAPFEVSKKYIDKHHPEVGGYYVVYKDGYKSFSPAEAFEDGYTRV